MARKSAIAWHSDPAAPWCEDERPLIKILETQALLCAPAPVGVLEGSRADVSFAAGLLIDKFLYHLPLYRQHQRLADSGITVSRPWLTQLAQRTISLLAPIYDAQFASIRTSRVKAMDETPIKAGRAGRGKMKTGYFWPVYGEADEVCFPDRTSRGHAHVRNLLGMAPAADAVLISDGYDAYSAYAKKTGLTDVNAGATPGARSSRPSSPSPPASARPLNKSRPFTLSKIIFENTTSWLATSSCID